MVAYCNKVCKLEDKFNGLELNHVVRRFNEATDELMKAASGRKPVPDSVFIRDQYKPSIRHKEPRGIGDAPSTPDSGVDPGEVDNAPPVLDSEADPSDPEELYKRSHTGILQLYIPIE
ncbi:uncharacterized protein [Setaria viridis]|uniref:uncharacterized protein n=1 Tax=Setaria viridis TaxID=4556 RepID=UPI0014933F9C|nr:uncharacterized protein LOC117864553 [Setaria viridis]